MVKAIANDLKKTSGVTSRSVILKKPAVVDEKKASPELVSMLGIYASHIHETTITADVFFKKLKAELGTVLRAHKIPPPKDMKIINTAGMLFGPPPVKGQFRLQDLRRDPESALTIGILWKTKEHGEKDNRTQLLYSEFLKVEVAPNTWNVKLKRAVMNKEKVTLNALSCINEAANIIQSLSMA